MEPQTKTHKFDVNDAVNHGVHKAILLEHIRFHQQANEGHPDMEYEGEAYAFVKTSTIQKMYPYFEPRSVRRWLRQLEDDGVIKSCKPLKKSGVHLKHYRIIAEKRPLEQSERTGQNDQSARAHGMSNFDQSARDLIGSRGMSNFDHSSIVTNVNKPPVAREGARETDSSNFSFTKAVESAESKKELLSLWIAYRRKKGKHPSTYELDVIINSEWRGKDIKQIKAAILYTVSNGWFSLVWPDDPEADTEPKPSYHEEF